MLHLKKSDTGEPSPEQVIWAVGLHGALAGGTTLLGAEVAADAAVEAYRARTAEEAK